MTIKSTKAIGISIQAFTHLETLLKTKNAKIFEIARSKLAKSDLQKLNQKFDSLRNHRVVTPEQKQKIRLKAVQEILSSLRKQKTSASTPKSAAAHIRDHHLQPLIETYVMGCAKSEKDHSEALNQLSNLAKKLCKLEKLPMKPTYANLSEIFSVVEAINLLRAMRKLHKKKPCSHFDGNLLKLSPFDIPAKIVEKAHLVRNWLNTHPNYLAAKKELSLSSCELTLLPKEIRLAAHLKKLDASSNRLVVLSRGIGRLKGLHELNISHNQLLAVPSELWQLSVLKQLYMHNNRIAQLSSKIEGLATLRIVDLSNNCLTSLPNEIVRVHSAAFNLSYNGLIKLPSGWEKYKSVLTRQKKALQLENIIGCLKNCLQKEKQDIHRISHLLDDMSLFIGKETRSLLLHCLRDVCAKAWRKSHPLRHKLRDIGFGRSAFLNPKIPAELKRKALENFGRMPNKPMPFNLPRTGETEFFKPQADKPNSEPHHPPKHQKSRQTQPRNPPFAQNAKFQEFQGFDLFGKTLFQEFQGFDLFGKTLFQEFQGFDLFGETLPPFAGVWAFRFPEFPFDDVFDDLRIPNPFVPRNSERKWQKAPKAPNGRSDNNFEKRFPSSGFNIPRNRGPQWSERPEPTSSPRFEQARPTTAEPPRPPMVSHDPKTVAAFTFLSQKMGKTIEPGADALTILGLKPGVNVQAIHHAYRTAAKKIHPDKNLDNKEVAGTAFDILHNAFTQLTSS